MKSLSATQQVELAQWQEKITTAIQEANAALTVANEKILAYNTLLEEAREWLTPLANQMEEYYDDKPESWKDSDAGNEYESWRNYWQDADFEPAEEVSAELQNPLDDLTSEPG